MRNNMKTLLVLSCMTISGAAFADTAEDLTKIESETAVLKAEAKKIEVQAQIAAKQAEITRLATPPVSTQSGMSYAALSVEPTVLSVEGIGKTRYATLSLGNGVTMDVKAGDVLPNGMKVLSIRSNEVVVGDGKKHSMRLAHGAASYGTGYSSGTSLPVPAPSGFGPASKGAVTR